MIRTNIMKKKLQEGKVVVGMTVLEWNRPSIAKLASLAGFDFLFLEQEHTFINEETMANIILLAREIDLPVIVKVPSLHRHFISRSLDMGAMGIQLPRTDTAEDVEKMVNCIKLPPIGDRAGCPGIAQTDYLPVPANEFFTRMNEETLVIAHIETQIGLQNLNEIATNDQVDVVFIGPYDLAASLGYPGESEHPVVLKEVTRVIEVSRRYGKAPGIAALDFDTARRWIDRGMQLIESASDIGMILDAGTELMGKFRKYLKY